LQIELQEEKNKNNYLSNENIQLKQQIFQLQNNMNNINFSNNQNNYSIDSLIKIVKAKEDLINNLNEKLKRFPFILEKNENLMSVIFSSVNQKVNYSIVCKNTDTIHNLEVKLYQEFPRLYESENYFLCKGQIINKFKTFEENKIKNGDTILLNQMNDSNIFN
jgi:molybdopterin converting factor small subunit